MRNIVIAGAIAGSAVTLAACSEGAENSVEAAAEETTAEIDAAGDMDMAADSAAVLDASTATAEQLADAEGVPPELAAAIVAGQPYASVTDFNAVLLKTLGAEEAAAVRAAVFVPVNLNRATREEIDLIPGMTARMAHEFEEYRPYADLAEFDREIGKYVDEAEVARFHNYVTL